MSENELVTCFFKKTKSNRFEPKIEKAAISHSVIILEYSLSIAFTSRNNHEID